MTSDLPPDLFSSPDLSGGPAARAVLVNRTHRIVRERAETLRSRRSRTRSLLVPMGVCAAFCVMIALAIWSLLNQYQEQYERAPVSFPDASNQFLVMLLWFLPVTLALIILSLVRRMRADRESVR